MLDFIQVPASRHVASKGNFRLGDWTVDPTLDRIGRGDTQVSLRPQVMDLLVFLAHHHKEVFSADELISRLWDGRVVTTASIYGALKQLRIALGDDAQNPRYIETIPKRGYRLIADVEFLRDQEPSPPGVSGGIAAGRAKVAWPHWRLAAIVLAGLAVMTYVVFFSRTELPDSATEVANPVPMQSVAVLPFVDMSPEGDQGWFIDGVADEILNKLAQVPGLKVTGRTSSFAFREPEAEVQTIGRTLGVAHLLEGSVRREGDRVRVTAQLIKTEDGFHVWSQEYDREVTEIFAIQDDISGKIANALKLELAASDAAGEAPVSFYPNFTAYELYLQARNLIWQKTGSSLMGALEKLKKALRLEPDFALAHVAMAETYIHLAGFSDYYQVSTLEPVAMARPHVEKALAIDPNLAEAYVVQGQIADGPQSVASFRQAISLNPTLAQAHLWLGVGLANSQLRSWNEPLPYLDKALELEPLSIEIAVALVEALQFVPHRKDDALAIIASLKTRHPDHPSVREIEALWWLCEGRLAQAVPLLEKALVLDPGALWARFLLNAAWFSLAETERALQAPHWQRQWRFVLSPDLAGTLAQMKEIDTKYPPGTVSPFNPGLSAYIYVMFGEWQKAVDALAARTQDPAAFLNQCGACASRYSPAVSLAVAYKALGDHERFKSFIELEKEALNIRSDFHRIQNSDFSRASARIDALENRPYEAILHLERLVTAGPLDPRDLVHPAFDEIRDLPRFRELEILQRQRVNSERGKLGLAPISGRDASHLAQKAEQ